MRHLAVAAAAAAGFAAMVQPSPVLAAPVPGTSCAVLPADSIWNTDISTLPVHPRSGAWLASTGATGGRKLHPDFGGDPYGIPFNVVNSAHATTTYTFHYASESDGGPYPYGADLRIENGSDAHRLVINQDTCRLYETFATDYAGPSTAGSGAIFDLNSNALRPDTWTSADAAGLPIFPGLVRFDEVAAGSIKHAIRFTVNTSDRSYLWPARHQAGSVNDPNVPPMGARFRLKSSYSIAGFNAPSQVVLNAMKHYGLIVADNGSDWFFTGTEDNNWNAEPYATMISQLKTVPASAFEAVDESGMMIAPNSGQARQPVPPPPPSSGAFHNLAPARVMDSRQGLGLGTFGPQSTEELKVLGVGGVPGSNVSAVVLNVTAVNAWASGWIAAFPGGTAWPGNSNLNFMAGGSPAPNLVIAQVGSNGNVAFANGSAGNLDLVGDVFGYFDAAGSGAGPAGRFRAITPSRFLDTRQTGGTLGTGGALTLPIAGHGPVPAGASAVALNLTATNASTGGWLAAFPAGTTWPGTSNVNFGPGETVPNRVIVPLGLGGGISILNASGWTDVVVDVSGWFTDGSNPTAAGGLYSPIVPGRLVDTRGGGPIGNDQSIAVPVRGQLGVPPAAVTVALNVTAVNETYPSFFALYPDPGPYPGTSDLNTAPGRISTNAVLVGAPNGSFDVIHATGSADVVIDVTGWFS